jgi:hypothetical protein
MADRKPAVITPSSRAEMLAGIAEMLREMPADEVFQVAYDSRPRVAQSVPSLSIVIRFDPETLNAKTFSISSTKKAAKEWNVAHGAKI